MLYQAGGQHPHRHSLHPGSAHDAAFLRLLPHPYQRIVAICARVFGGTLHNELRRSMSPSAQETRVESSKRFTKRESHFQIPAEMDQRQPKQEYAQTGINTPVSSERTARVSVGSSGPRIRSAGSSAVTSKRFGADSEASTPAKPATAERAYAADGVGSVSRGDNSRKREHLGLRSATRLKRVMSISGSLLGGPSSSRPTKTD